MDKLKDYFGNEVNVGDIILGATPRKNYYQDTSYSIAVVIGRTKKMLRLHKLGEMEKDAALCKQEILARVRDRMGRIGGRVPSCNVINLKKPTGINQEEFTRALEQGKRVQNVQPIFNTVFP